MLIQTKLYSLTIYTNKFISTISNDYITTNYYITYDIFINNNKKII